MHAIFRSALTLVPICLMQLSAVSPVVAQSSDAQSPNPQTQATYRFDLPEQPLAEALRAIARQTGANVLFQSKDLQGIRAPALQAQLTIAEAIERILAKTKLIAQRTTPTTVVIQPVPRQTIAVGSGNGLAGQVIAGLQLVQSEEQGNGAPMDEGSADKKASKKSQSDVEEMVVEKERIRPFSDANVDQPRTINDQQPYYIFDSKTIERSGALNVQDFLRQRLTMDTTFQTSSETYVSIGYNAGFLGASSSFNLRGLGADKTLILVNGRRIAGVNYSRSYTGMSEYQPDLNGVPLAAIDRIEVLPSSASAIYGGNALGGVINVILKQQYQGGQLSFNRNAPLDSSASTTSGDAVYGFSLEGGRTNVMASAHYSKSDPMLLGDRLQYMEGNLRLLNDSAAAQGRPAGAFFSGKALGPTSVNVYATGTGATYTPTINLILKNGTDLGNALAYIAPGVSSSTPSAQRFIPGYPLTANPGYGQYGAAQPLGTPSDVKSFNVSVERKMTNSLTAFVSFMQNNNSAHSFLSPMENNYYSIARTDVGNPFSNTNIRVALSSPQRFPIFSDSMTRSATLGLKAFFAGGWSGEVDYTLSRNTFDSTYYQVDNTQIGRDFRNGLLDLFVDPFSNPVDLSSYVSENHTIGYSRVDDYAVRLAGPLFHLPWGDPTLSLGLQRTKSSMPESQYNSYGTGAGFGSVTGQARNTVRLTFFAQSQISDALYAEGVVPLVTEKNAVPLVRSLDVQLAQRFSRYQAQTGTQARQDVFNGDTLTQVSYYPVPADSPNGFSGGTPIRSAASYASHNQTIALRYRPLEEVTFRTSLATAFLPPTYSQLIPDRTLKPGQNITEPGRGTYSVNIISGGNPDLQPQTSESIDAGLIYEPQSKLLNGLRVNLEFYRITQHNFITQLSATQILTDPTISAARVTRDPNTGFVTQIDTSYINVYEYSTTGVDLSFQYEKRFAPGTLSFSLAGTKINNDRRQLSFGKAAVNIVNIPYWGGAVKYKANANVVWDTRHLSLGWGTNWFGSYRMPYTPGDEVGGFQTYPSVQWNVLGSYSVPPQMYHRLFVGYKFDSDTKFRPLNGLSLQLNVNNIFNTVPPFDVNITPFYLSPLGSYRLREYTLAIKKAF